ncbi:MAG TPA: hypothetical protein PLS00_08840, partial [Niabella sp.]|nr:hypothetical protein [Niabella sp.]
MYKLQSVIGSVILIIFLYACTPSQPTTKTNVLSNPAGSETDVKGNKRMSAWEMQNYHKNLPKAAPPAERKTPVREAKKEIKKEANPTAVVIKPEEPVSQTSVNSNTVTSASFAYRSKEYYKFITDSIQAASAKAAYYQIADSMMRMMTQLPVNSKNPAIDLTQWYTTPNFSIRKPNYVMLHHTAQTTAEQTLYT